MAGRVLVCGGRDYLNYEAVYEALVWYAPSLVIHGDARGADTLAADAASNLGIAYLAFPADWKQYGKAAGYIRNSQMLREGKPDLVLAFPGGRGTANMMKQARAAGVEVVDMRLPVML